MPDNHKQEETIRCSGCKKQFFADGFKVTRLGRRLKTCLECNDRQKVKAERYKCLHDRRRNTCHTCGGSQICEHGHQRNKCWICDPVGALWNRANIRIRDAIGTEARAGRSTDQLLGCDKATFYHHVEAQFKDGMCWARISEIQIDHRMPIGYKGVAGGSPTHEEKVARLNYLNCQPMWAPDNKAKGNRWADPLPEAPPALTLSDADIEELLGFTL